MKKAMWARDKEKILAWAMGSAVLLIVVISVVVVSMVFVKNNQRVERRVEKETMFDDWGEYINNKDAVGLIEMTDRQIESTDDNEVKSIIYATRANILYGFDIGDDNADYGAQVLSDIHNAEECYPTGDSAYMVYVYEQEYGDTAVAEKYLKLAEERGEIIPPGKG